MEGNKHSLQFKAKKHQDIRTELFGDMAFEKMSYMPTWNDGFPQHMSVKQNI